MVTISFRGDLLIREDDGVFITKASQASDLGGPLAIPKH